MTLVIVRIKTQKRRTLKGKLYQIVHYQYSSEGLQAKIMELSAKIMKKIIYFLDKIIRAHQVKRQISQETVVFLNLNLGNDRRSVSILCISLRILELQKSPISLGKKKAPAPPPRTISAISDSSPNTNPKNIRNLDEKGDLFNKNLHSVVEIIIQCLH